MQHEGSPPESVLAESRPRSIYYAAVGGLGGLVFGYYVAVANGADRSIEFHFGVSERNLGWVVAAALLAAGIGCLLAGVLTNRFGRKRIALCVAVLAGAAGIGQALSGSLAVFVTWRIVGGFAIGAASVVAPMYIAEISPRKIRGTLTALFQFGVVIGILATSIVNALLLAAAAPPAATQPAQPDSNGMLWGLPAWRWMFLFVLVPAAIYFVLTFTIPESPRYLVQQGRSERALRVLRVTSGRRAAADLRAIEQSFRLDPHPTARDLRGPRFGLQPIVWIGILISAFSQLVGVNVVIYYSNLVYRAADFDQSKAFLASSITMGVNFLFTIIALVTIDRVGRKRLLVVGSTGMAVCLAVIAVIFAMAPRCTESLLGHGLAGCAVKDDLNQPIMGHNAGIMAIIAVNLFIAFYASTWGPVAWVLIAEMFPNRIRAAGLAVAAMASWLTNFVVTAAFPGIAGISISLAFGVFAALALLSIWFVLAKVKETKGVELEDMDRIEAAEVR